MSKYKGKYGGKKGQKFGPYPTWRTLHQPSFRHSCSLLLKTRESASPTHSQPRASGPGTVSHMCRRRPDMPGDTSNGINIMLVQHADVVFSGGAFILILVSIGAFCLCLQWVLGPRFLGQQASSNGTNGPCTSTTISMPGQQPASALQVTDQVEVEFQHIQRSKQLIELQQRRSQLLAQATLGDQGGSRALSAKYPVMGNQ